MHVVHICHGDSWQEMVEQVIIVVVGLKEFLEHIAAREGPGKADNGVARQAGVVHQFA